MQQVNEQLSNIETYTERCERSGYLARAAGIPLHKCPLTPKSAAWRAWVSGWQSKDRDQ